MTSSSKDDAKMMMMMSVLPLFAEPPRRPYSQSASKQFYGSVLGKRVINSAKENVDLHCFRRSMAELTSKEWAGGKYLY